MRCDVAITRRKERIVVSRRFGREYIDGGSGNLSRVEGIGEVLFAHERTATGVDNNGRRLHGVEALGIDQMLGVGSERAVEREHIA